MSATDTAPRPPDFNVCYSWTRGEKRGWYEIGHAYKLADGQIEITLMASPHPAHVTKPGVIRLFPAKDNRRSKSGDAATAPAPAASGEEVF